MLILVQFVVSPPALRIAVGGGIQELALVAVLVVRPLVFFDRARQLADHGIVAVSVNDPGDFSIRNAIDGETIVLRFNPVSNNVRFPNRRKGHRGFCFTREGLKVVRQLNDCFSIAIKFYLSSIYQQVLRRFHEVMA